MSKGLVPALWPSLKPVIEKKYLNTNELRPSLKGMKCEERRQNEMFHLGAYRFEENFQPLFRNIVYGFFCI